MTLGQFALMANPTIQLWTIKVIKFDNLRMRIFMEILTSDLESGTSKMFKKGVALFFSCFFGLAKFLGIFHTCYAPKSAPHQLYLD